MADWLSWDHHPLIEYVTQALVCFRTLHVEYIVSVKSIITVAIHTQWTSTKHLYGGLFPGHSNKQTPWCCAEDPGVDRQSEDIAEVLEGQTWGSVGLGVLGQREQQWSFPRELVKNPWREELTVSEQLKINLTAYPKPCSSTQVLVSGHGTPGTWLGSPQHRNRTYEGVAATFEKPEKDAVGPGGTRL